MTGPRPEPPPGPVGPPGPGATGFLLMALGRAVRDDVEAGLRGHGVSLRHVSALGHLSRSPGLSYSELGRRAGVTPQSMLVTLRQLEQRGAVERRTPTGRGRTAQLHVTSLGTELVVLGQQALAAAETAALAGLSKEHRDRLGALLALAFEAGRGPGTTGKRDAPPAA